MAKDSAGVWHIRDHGRGLHYEHLTQKGNSEKLGRTDEVIGKLGVGLKDALATFDRHQIEVRIESHHSQITIGKVPKHRLENVKTLHALIASAADFQM